MGKGGPNFKIYVHGYEAGTWRIVARRTRGKNSGEGEGNSQKTGVLGKEEKGVSEK